MTQLISCTRYKGWKSDWPWTSVALDFYGSLNVNLTSFYIHNPLYLTSNTQPKCSCPSSFNLSEYIKWLFPIICYCKSPFCCHHDDSTNDDCLAGRLSWRKARLCLCLSDCAAEPKTSRAYRKTSNTRLGSNKSRPLIGAGCTEILNFKNASNYMPLIRACLQ